MGTEQVLCRNGRAERRRQPVQDSGQRRGTRPDIGEFTPDIPGSFPIAHRQHTMNVQPLKPDQAVPHRELAARLEPFDSYWQAPQDIEGGFKSFTAYYKANYLPHLPADRNAKVLVVSCGPGYLLNALKEAGYRNVVGIDSDPTKVSYGQKRGLACEAAQAFPYLERHRGEYDVIIPEQELNHLTIDETIEFLRLCHASLKPGGKVIVYAMNGANPFVGSENLSHNIDHFYNVTEYSLSQLLQLGGFGNIRPFALKLYVFWKNPLNYVGLAVTSVAELTMRAIFMLYGKKVRVLSKKVAAVGVKMG